MVGKTEFFSFGKATGREARKNLNVKPERVVRENIWRTNVSLFCYQPIPKNVAGSTQVFTSINKSPVWVI